MLLSFSTTSGNSRLDALLAPLERLVTPATLRATIRGKLRAGVSPQAITLIIGAYAPPDAPAREDCNGRRRVAIEHVPVGERVALLHAIEGLVPRRRALDGDEKSPAGERQGEPGMTKRREHAA